MFLQGRGWRQAGTGRQAEASRAGMSSQTGWAEMRQSACNRAWRGRQADFRPLPLPPSRAAISCPPHQMPRQ
jgi:hypothetical protein